MGDEGICCGREDSRLLYTLLLLMVMDDISRASPERLLTSSALALPDCTPELGSPVGRADECFGDDATLPLLPGVIFGTCNKFS